MLIEPKNTQRGAVALIVALMMTLLLGFGALAVDIGNLLVVRNELQNAADASALSGAGYFYQGTPVPNWDLAEQKTTEAISLNQVTKVPLTDGDVRSGYWNLAGTPGELQLLPMTPTAQDAPAVKVTINKLSGKNGGEVKFYLAPILGINTASMSATAVAVVSSPGNVGPGGLFPVAIGKCMYDNYWDSTATPPGPKNDPATGKPYVFNIFSLYHPVGQPNCSSGQWTTFADDVNDVASMRNLISNGNSGTLGIGDGTWIQPGTKDTLFSSVNDCSAAGDKSCEYETVPVVSLDASQEAHYSAPTLALACIHILSASKKDKSIQAQMSTKCKTPNSGGVGPAYGALTPPRLAQ